VRNEAAFAEAIDNLGRLAIDALVVIGGEGTQRAAYEFCTMGVRLVGVPKTIDNDLSGTEQTFGFDTAVNIATEALDRLHTTAESHDRVLLLEVMGRDAGWIALHCGIAGGADVILIPELPFSNERVAEKILERERVGRKFSIIVVAEGAIPAGGKASYLQGAGTSHAARLGGIAERTATEIARLTGKESRVVVLGHLQRGGSPTALDRMLAGSYGSGAVHAIAEGKFGHLVSWNGTSFVTVPLESCVSHVRVVPADHQLLAVARDLGISFGDGRD
jgi:6-phosphofructokinase 1